MSEDDSWPEMDMKEVRKAWLVLLHQFLERYEAAAKRGVQTAKLALERDPAAYTANQLAYWEDVVRAIAWLRWCAPGWAKKNIK